MRLVLALGIGSTLAAGGCFKGDFVQGLPCEGDGECGSLKCENGFCGGRPDTAGDGGSTSNTSVATMMTSSQTASTVTLTGSSTTDPIRMTESAESTGGSSSDSTTGPPGCMIPAHSPCDAGDTSLTAALGLGCPGEPAASTSLMGAPQGNTIVQQVSGFTPREGDAFVVLSTGLTPEIFMETPDGDLPNNPTFCSDDNGAILDPGLTLPAPLTPLTPMANCIGNEAAVMMDLDCSETIGVGFTEVANDYVAIQVTADAPPDASSMSFRFAFSSVEYPFYVGQQFNDLFVAWLDSEEWSGNVAFSNGMPISVNSNLFTITDDDMTDPMLSGTCIRGHGSTGWLRTIAPVRGGEQLTLTFAVFDQFDNVFDSMVFLDGVRFGCAPTAPPQTGN